MGSLFAFSSLFNNVFAYDLTEQDQKFVTYMTEKLEQQIENQGESRRTFILLTLAQFANRYQNDTRIYTIFNELILQLDGNQYNQTEWEGVNLQTQFDKIYTNTALLIDNLWISDNKEQIHLNFSFNQNYLGLDEHPDRIPQIWDNLTNAILHCTAYSYEEIPDGWSTMPVYAIRGKRFAKNITYIPLNVSSVLEMWWQADASFDFPSVLDKTKDYSFVCYIFLKDISLTYESPSYTFDIN